MRKSKRLMCANVHVSRKTVCRRSLVDNYMAVTLDACVHPDLGSVCLLGDNEIAKILI